MVNIQQNKKWYLKEYDNNNRTLLAEGEYLNGDKNGMIKEYKSGNLLFEGYYI